MKKLYPLFLINLLAYSAFGQGAVTQFFPAAASPGGENNVQLLVDGYITPIAEDFGSLINNGWYNTAATHKRFGFDLSVTVNTLSAKSDQKYFNVPTTTGVSFIETTARNSKAPTAYVPSGQFPRFRFNSGPNNAIEFRGPDGSDISNDMPVGFVAVPTLQIGVGLFANTDLLIRYTPTLEISGTELSNWGVGFHHDIKQHIPGIKAVPFSLSAFVAYSRMEATTDLSGVYASNGTRQEGVAETSVYTIQVLVSKKIALLTLYAGVGYNRSTTDYAINGTYVVNTTSEGVPLVQGTALTNPYKRESSVSGVRATAGLRFNLGPIILNGDYSFVNSNGLLTAGFGVTVR